jgi:translation initiation factor 5B
VIGEDKKPLSIGKVVGIELNHKPRQEVKRGDPSVAIRVESASYETPKMYGRHFTEADEFYSFVSPVTLRNVLSCID